MGICQTLRQVLETNKDGFDLRAQRVLDGLARRSMSADIKSSAEGVLGLGMMTEKK